ncbi:MAG TPA: hypothetical protein PJ988_20420, partial [Anaerolinea sp.]|nr:hypothetical protein [Anaerolinea sp.]
NPPPQGGGKEVFEGFDAVKRRQIPQTSFSGWCVAFAAIDLETHMFFHASLRGRTAPRRLGLERDFGNASRF